MSSALRFSLPWRGILLGALLGLALPGLADTLSEDRVKAGFIYNFVKYTDWPAAATSGGSLRVCSPGQQALSGELRQLQGRPALGRTIEVELAVRPEQWKTCQVLFIPGNDAKLATMAIESLARLPVLTVSDSAEFIDAGGMIGLKQMAGRIRFDINLGSTRRAGLGLSSQLLKLADKVAQ